MSDASEVHIVIILQSLTAKEIIMLDAMKVVDIELLKPI